MTSFTAKVFPAFVRRIFNRNKELHSKDISTYTLFRVLVALTVILTFIVESIQREDAVSALEWLAQNPQIFLVNAVIVMLIMLFFISLTGSLRGAVFSSSLFLVFFSLANMAKKQFLGDPLFPWDFLRVDQVMALLPHVSGEIVIILVSLLAFAVLVFFICLRFIPFYHLRRGARLSIMLGMLILLPLLIFYRHTPIQTAFNKAKIEYLYWIQTENSLQNGFVLGFTMNLENIMILKPAGYEEETIAEVIENNRQNTVPAQSPNTVPAQTQNSKSYVKPNIIVILSESFWDPTVLPGVQFSEDPIPYFRSLGTESCSGTMVSPVFGGSTANVEFEILTGLSTKFLPQGSIAYQQYVKKPLPALPQLFKDQGYMVTALHPYHDWFYKRNTVYPNLGFEHFYSLNDFAGAKIKGEYIGDAEVSKKIIEQVDSTRDSAFILAVTMQNHGPYPENRYQENQIKVAGNLPAASKKLLETYVQGLKDADDSLKTLAEHYKKSSEPTVILFFGDHLPYLGKDYLLYRETGYIQGKEKSWTAEENLKMKSSPFVIWTNFQTTVPELTYISPQYLGLYLLDLAGLKDNDVFSFVRSMQEILPVESKTVNLDSENHMSSKIPAEYQGIEDNYWLLEYDLLFGQRYYYQWGT